VGDVVFKCPVSAKEFVSGFRAEPGDLKDLPAKAAVHLRCQVCGQMHDFKFADARIDNEPAKVR
jgi:hypothetical protein